MRKSEKLTLGCLTALAFSCVTGTLILYFTGSFQHLFGTARLVSAGQAVTSIGKKFPFEPPVGSGVSDERLSVYLKICAQVKPRAEKVEEWHRTNDGGHDKGRKVFRWQASGLVADLMKELKDSFETNGMGPDEFAWIARRMAAAAAAPPPQEKIDAINTALESMKPLADNPHLSKEEKELLLKEMQEIQDLPEAWGPSAKADLELYKRREAAIKTCLLGEHASRIATGFSTMRPGRRDIRIETGKPASPPP